MKRTIFFGLAALIAGSALQAQDEAAIQKDIERAREVISKYVDTRQKIAREKNEWKAYQELTERRINLYEKEIENLQASIDKAANETTQAEKEISGIRDSISELRSATDIVNKALPSLEAKLRELNQFFPLPLKTKIQPLVRQLGKGRLASERMAIVIGILNEVDKFNSEFMFDTDEKTLASGETKLVDVIYIGLSIAYYADKEGTIGGVGTPAAGEWKWTANNEKAPAIRDAILYYNGDIKPAMLVNLPVDILDLKIGN